MIFYSVTVAKCVAEIYAEVPDPVIRVLISDSDFQSYYHSFVTVAYNGREIRYEAEELQKQKTTIRIPAQKDGICIQSLKRHVMVHRYIMGVWNSYRMSREFCW